MAAQTEPNSGLYHGWSRGESNWDVEVNANWTRLGRALTQLSVKDRDLTTPPASPTLGDRYLVPSGATGAWSGQTNKLTVWDGAAWAFYTPATGWTAVVQDETHALITFDGTRWRAPMVGGWLSARAFGVVGDGTTDDRAALQSALSATFGHLQLDRATYRAQTNGGAQNLVLNHPAVIDFQGSTLKHVVLGGSTNRSLVIESSYGTAVTWTETIAAGVTTFTVSGAPAVGSQVLLELGTHPNDATIAHYYKLATVVANSGTTVSLDTVVPYAINGTSHKIYPLTSVAEDIVIRNLIIEPVASGGLPDIQLTLRSARNIRIENLEVRNGSLGISIARGCENIHITNYKCHGINHGTPQSGRALTVWGARQIRIDHLITHANVDAQQVLYFEGGTRDVHIGTWWSQRTLTAIPTAPLLRSVGDSQGIRIDRLRIAANFPEYLIIRTENGAFSVGELALDTTPYNVAIDETELLEYKGSWRGRAVSYRKTISVVGAQTNLDVPIVQGYIRRFYIHISSLTDITAVATLDNGGQTNTILSQLVAGSWVRLANDGALNEAHAGLKSNDARYPTKSLRFSSGATANATVTVYVEYFPSGVDMGKL